MTQRNWIFPPNEAVDIPAWAAQLTDAHPIAAQVLLQRGLTDATTAAQFINPAQYTPAPPDDLPDMAQAIARVQHALTSAEKILIWGDFDVDGQTSTALLTSALAGLGADVSYYIPDRKTEGHGIHTPRLAQLIDTRGIQLVITCDTGIAEHDAVDYANSQGVDVVITDHHQLPPTLPDAIAAVNPQRLPSGHPLHTLPGVGCAYKLIEALYAFVGRADETAQFLDLVALGIVADVVVLTGDARYLLQRGLDVLRHTPRLGLRALYALAEVNPALLNEETIGFQIAPRLNAVGRLADANLSVEFLTTEDEARALTLANQLEGLNNQRRFDTERVTSAALEMIEENPKLLESPALVLMKSGWPGGIVGIVANRLVEQFHRPVILLSEDDDGHAHGSARSVAGCDITAAIAQVAQQHPDMIHGFGGHTMAAGVNLPAVRVGDFRRAVGRAVAAQLGIDAEQAPPTLHIDAVLSFADVGLGLVHALRKVAPFGPGNPAPVFATCKVTLQSQRQIGRSGEHIRLTVTDESGNAQDVLWWRAKPETLPKGRFDLAYQIGINEFKGEQNVQAVLTDFRAVVEAPQTFAQREAIAVTDYRHLPDAEQAAALNSLPTDVIIWNEGDPLPQRASVRRDGLQAAHTLAIWTCPPSTEVLHAALEVVNPARVILFAQLPGTDALNSFLGKMAGLTAYLLKAYDGETRLDKIAGALGHRAEAARIGLRSMHGRGHITILHDDGDLIRVGAGGTKNDALIAETTQALMAWLAEAKAYRAYYKSASAQAVLGLPVKS